MCSFSHAHIHFACASLCIHASQKQYVDQYYNQLSVPYIKDSVVYHSLAVQCREYFVDMVCSHKELPMLLEECSTVREDMDGTVHSIELMTFRCRQGNETVGVKRLKI